MGVKFLWIFLGCHITKIVSKALNELMKKKWRKIKFRFRKINLREKIDSEFILLQNYHNRGVFGILA